MILLDCQPSHVPEDPTDRGTMFAEMASLFLNECRDIDVLARFTETVFMFLLPGTGTGGAEYVARRMLDGLRKRELVVPVKLDPVVGIATVPMSGIRDRKAFLARAEACLEVARQGQGDRGLCYAMP